MNYKLNYFYTQQIHVKHKNYAYEMKIITYYEIIVV